MKIMILGATGMLGKALVREANRREISVIGIARSGTDLAVDMLNDGGLTKAVQMVQPDIIINAAALTSLDMCEKRRDIAYLTNSRSISILTELCASIEAYFIHISTDHYFIGDGDKKHRETDAVHLVNEYARTKYAGELFALTYDNALVLRTNIVGFRGNPSQPTFIEWAIQSMKSEVPMTLFSDFFTSSIHVRQFARALFDLLPKRLKGTLNLASREVSNKQQFITRLADRLGQSLPNSVSGRVNDFSEVRRAESLGLDVSQAETLLGYRLPGVEEVIDSLLNEYRERSMDEV